MSTSAERRHAMRRMLGRLREGPASHVDLDNAARTRPRTTTRLLAALRQEHDARIDYVPSAGGYVLRNAHESFPGLETTPDHHLGVLVGHATVRALGQTGSAARLRELYDDLLERDGVRQRPFHADAFHVGSLSAATTQHEHLERLLRSCRRRVLLVRYERTWQPEDSSGARTSEHVFEPWLVRLFEGVLYVYGFSQTREQIRTFRVANIRRVQVLSDQKPRARVPARLLETIDDGSYGVDGRDGGTATIRLEGDVARYVLGLAWHPTQRDQWDEERAQLTRVVKYASRREFARKLTSFADGMVSVDPPELRSDLERLLRAGVHRLLPPGPASGSRRRSSARRGRDRPRAVSA